MPTQNDVVVVRDTRGLDTLRARVEESPLPVGFDTEMHGREVRWKDKTWLDWYSAELTGFSVSIGPDNWYVPVAHTEGGNAPRGASVSWLAWLSGLASSRRIWSHNLKAELQILRNLGISVGRSDQEWCCSQLAAWLAGWGSDHKSLRLKTLAVAHGFGAGSTYEDVAKRRSACDVPVTEMAPYAGRDAWLAAALGELAYGKLREHGLVAHYHDIDMPLVEIVRSIEAWGTPVDAVRVGAQMARLKGEADEIAATFEFLTETTLTFPVKERQHTGEFYKNGNPKMVTVEVPRPFIRGCAIGNDHQVSRWMYDELQLWPTSGLKHNGARHWPTDKEIVARHAALPGVAGELAAMRLEWSLRDKLIKTYLKPLLELPPQYADGLLHTSLNITGTSTQRFSSSQPNLQNIPSRTREGKMIREALRARAGYTYIIYDYSQIELRIMAHLSRDPELMACYLLDIDVHAGTLEKMRRDWATAERVNAKTTNFSTIYRISAESLAVKMRVGVAQAQAAIDAFYATFENVADYHEAAIAYAAKYGHARTIDGFMRFLDVEPRWNYRTKRKEMAWSVANEAINTPIQGSAAGLMKIAMIAMWRHWVAKGVYGTEVVLAGQEHDAAIVEATHAYAPTASAEMKFCMETAMSLRVPITAEGGAGPSWGEAKH